jgi:extradiol dioxygenase family protein
MKQSVEFYHAVLRLKPKMESADWTVFELHGNRVCLHSSKPEESYPLNGIVIFESDGIKDLFEQFKNKGLAVFNLHETSEKMWTFHMRDHDGNEHSYYGKP